MKTYISLIFYYFVIFATLAVLLYFIKYFDPIFERIIKNNLLWINNNSIKAIKWLGLSILYTMLLFVISITVKLSTLGRKKWENFISLNEQLGQAILKYFR
jgi:hypothetical protein